MANTFQKDFVRHPSHYFILLCVELIGVWGIFWFSYQPTTQFLVIVYMAAAYVVWGVLHHSKVRDLHPKIVLEYLLFALIAILLLGVLIIKP